MIRFWMSGTFSGPISTPRSPRATMMPSAAVDDLGQAVDGLRLLDLGDDRDGDAVVGEQALGLAHVLGPAHERQGDVVDAVAQPELDVLPVLVGQGRGRHLDPGQVDALVVLEDAAGDHQGVDLVVGHAGHHQAEVAVVEQEVVTRADVGDDAGVGGRDPAVVADQVGVGRDRELGAGLELGLAGGESPDPDLGALQVEQHGDGPAALLRLGPDRGQHAGVVLVAAVREVEADHVHAGLDQLADPLGARRRGAQGTHDLGAGHRAQ
jgi:hypothetical protein